MNNEWREFFRMEVLRELLGMLAKREHTHHTAKREEKNKMLEKNLRENVDKIGGIRNEGEEEES